MKQKNIIPTPKPKTQVEHWKRLMDAARGGLVYNFCREQYLKALEQSKKSQLTP